MNGADAGTDNRLACLKHIPGLLLPGGVVVCAKNSPLRPHNTSWLKIPLEDGSVIWATVNCVRRSRKGVYEVTKKDAEDISPSMGTPRMFDVEEEEEYPRFEQYMIGITKTRPNKEGNRRFVVRFLGGRMDLEKSLFYAEIDEEIVTFSTGDKVPDLARGRVSDDAVGPVPTLKPKRPKKDDSS